MSATWAHAASADDAVLDSKAHYERALKLIDGGRFEEAATNLERAYALTPHFAVLYNLGKAYALLNRPIDAVDALTRYLDLGGDRIDVTRRLEVEELTRRLLGQVARLDLHVEPAGALVRAENRSFGNAPFGAPLLLTPGRHTLTVSRDGYKATERSVNVEAGQIQALSVSLSPLPQPTARVALTCPLPDVEVRVDGTPRGVTPLAPLSVDAGTRAITLTRPGYAPRSETLSLGAGTVNALGCKLRPLAESSRSRVTVIPSEPDAAIVVDGISVEEAVQLPPGRHRVRVEKEGFEPWERLIPVTDARDARVQVRLSPQTATRLKYERDAERLRVWSYVSLAGGAAMAGTSVALAIWNNGRNADWEREDEALDAVFRAGPPYPEDAQARQAKNDELLNAIEQTDVAVLSTAIIGAAGLAIGVALLGFGPDPHRYRTEVGLGPGAASCRVSF